MEEFLDNLFTESMMELLFDTAQDAVNEMAHEYIVEKAIRGVIMMMVNEIIEADGQNLVKKQKGGKLRSVNFLNSKFKNPILCKKHKIRT